MQAMPDGGRIQIDVGSNENFVVIHFDDEGRGIPEDIMEKIWDPFFTNKEKGSGLGLGIVKNIIEGHGGSIQISNRPVRGVRVTIELPIMKPEPNPSEAHDNVTVE
jgi:signal transduction histidine kinase